MEEFQVYWNKSWPQALTKLPQLARPNFPAQFLDAAKATIFFNK